MHDIEISLKNLTETSFEFCTDCGEAICFARLIAIPGTKLYVNCQSRHEKNYEHESDPSL